MTEEFERLDTMFYDDGSTWDLSENDKKAIGWAMDRIREQELEIHRLQRQTAPLPPPPVIIPEVFQDSWGGTIYRWGFEAGFRGWSSAMPEENLPWTDLQKQAWQAGYSVGKQTCEYLLNLPKALQEHAQKTTQTDS